MSCLYKKVFETAALSNLLVADGYACIDGESIGSSGSAFHRNMANMDHEYSGYFQDSFDKSNSCIYNTKAHVTTKGNPKMLELNRWEVCERPHCETNSGYKVANEAGDSSKRQGKNANCRTLSPSVNLFPAMLRLTRNHHHGNTCRIGSAGSNPPILPVREPSMPSTRSDTPPNLSSSTGSLSNNKPEPIKIGRRFRHFPRNSSYMDQYRVEYTYRRLAKARDLNNLQNSDSSFCSCGSQACLVSKSSIHSWRPSQSLTGKSKTLPVYEKNPCLASGIPVTKRKPVLKNRKPAKQPYIAQIPKIGDAPKNSLALGPHRDCIPKLEKFFATSLTVNNYNPVETPPSPGLKPASNSASAVLMNCGRVTNSPVCMAASFLHLLNQNLKGTE
ncbi:uncharacterized protein LOC123536232 [Mercenaria mercenaria]|uniref:uncharacterized protein LOC123536232 n=1 Tax=Mercenaria mercenaria TaxID=6596 RepID=UPI00234EA047|nr:uncharacterized protein LOC123536232 [Mercenaria mercenaria]